MGSSSMRVTVYTPGRLDTQGPEGPTQSSNKSETRWSYGGFETLGTVESLEYRDVGVLGVLGGRLDFLNLWISGSLHL
ncbi:hypothetical protein K0M31_002487 [Melipona bicolor]|uniref:Uncharacterized protein n=1 Tax=Melipona bicolor TaxID=60889 RepID=A0AA40GHN1_9HYME|nr:hypothetical protein K0M31_002487 [Melipona bicolor]